MRPSRADQQQLLRWWQGQRFREQQLKAAERVYWRFPTLKVENTQARLKDVIAAVESDPDHVLSREVARLFAAYREDLLKSLVLHEKRYNKGSMPQVAIVRERPPSCGVEHAAMHVFCCAWQDVITDATEETHLLHPDASRRA